MIAGKLALGRLSLEFGNAKRRFEDLSERLSTLTRKEERLIEQERSLVEELARTYLPELSPEAVSRGLTQLAREMAEALARQEAHRAELQDRIASLPADISRRELFAAEAERAEEHAARALEEVRARVSAELAGRPEHVRAVSEHKSIMQRRSILTARRTRLQTTASAERYRYDEDPAYSYLRGRGFGEPEYRAGFVTRRLDAWLAKRIDYERLRRNHLILLTGPRVMHKELHDLTGRARELERDVDRTVADAADRHALPAALAAERAAQEALVDARKALAEARERYDRIAAEIRAVDSNRGRPYEDALEAHRDFLEDRSVRELVDIARATPDPKDDGLVERIEAVRTDLDAVGGELRELRARMEDANRGATGLGDLLRRAAEHFASRRSSFSEEVNLPHLVRSVVEGESDPDDAFARLSASHVKEPLILPVGVSDLDGWFADLSARFDPELGAVEVRREHESEIASEVVVYDNQGRVLHRRVTRRDTA